MCMILRLLDRTATLFSKTTCVYKAIFKHTTQKFYHFNFNISAFHCFSHLSVVKQFAYLKVPWTVSNFTKRLLTRCLSHSILKWNWTFTLLCLCNTTLVRNPLFQVRMECERMIASRQVAAFVVFLFTVAL